MKNYFDNFYDWWKNIDKYIFSLIFILFFFGLFFSLASTSLIASDKLDTNSYYFFVKHFIFIIIAITILMIFYSTHSINFAFIFFLLSLFILL